MKKVSTGNSGFTLMELLISITILSVIVLLILSALRISTNAWEKGEENIESGQRLRAVIEMMVGQIEAIRTDRVYAEDGEKYYLKGDTHTLSFVTTGASDTERASKTVHLTYLVETEAALPRLILTERDIPVLPPLSEDTETEIEESKTTLLPECFDVHFEYLKNITDEDGMQWQETWTREDEAGVPLAVRIVLQKDEGSPPIQAIVRFVRDPKETVKYKWNVN